MKQNVLKPFVWTGLVWLLVGIAACQLLPSGRWSALVAAAWMAGIWFLVMADITALAMLVRAIFKYVAPAETANPAISRPIQAFYWGLIKLACLGFLVAVVCRQSAIPASGFLLGLGTLAVVPALGGLIWSQRLASHA